MDIRWIGLPQKRSPAHRRRRRSGSEAAALRQRVGDNAFHLRFARQRLADEVPDEATNDDVLAQFGNLGIQQVANCHIGIFDEALFEQAIGAIKFLEFALDNLVRNLRRLALYLCLVDFAFSTAARTSALEARATWARTVPSIG